MQPQENIKVSLIQTHLAWETPKANLEQFSRKLEQLYGVTDLVVLPEMFTTGFSMNAQQHASSEQIIEYLMKHAKKGKFAIYGSVMFRDGERFVNRGFFVRPDRTYDFYDKRHTFTLAKEHEVYHKGEKPIISEYLGWKFNLQICYDLRFPVFSRNTQEYDVLLYVANWPVPRINAWDALLKARAIENMCYTIGVNRTGLDGNGMEYNGHSQAYDLLGEEMIEDHPWENQNIKTVQLKKSHINLLREKLQFLGDRDDFKLS
ncbi:MAG: nitrilase family protein [Nonlabens sp.]|uniref:nitrilase family protein n=1 Tax=Nonlabens sp. TaxID=1888209 RepID=UPI003EFA63D1